RKQDPSGEYVEDPELPGVMLPRRLEDAGPYYKLWPEGTIENFDGTHVPDPHYLSDNDVDLNRNFPHSWRPEPEQVGAGPFGASEPESRAVIAYACELWDLFARLGIERKKPFVDHYSHLTRENLLALAKLDREQNQGRIFRGWKAFRHPQLGELEVGGTVMLVGLNNPPYELIAEICERQSAAYLRVAALAPALEMDVHAAGGRVEAGAGNAGHLPTYILDSAKKLALDA